jgi:hydroxypyruvate reductase
VFRPSQAWLEGILAESLAGVHAGAAVRRVLERNSSGSLSLAGRALPQAAGLWVAAMGKAAAPMASAFAVAARDRLREGMAITCDGHERPLPAAISLQLAGHPVPDSRGEEAARQMLDLVSRIPEDDVLVVLLSGGASALTSLPSPGLALSDLIEATRLLLASGADIHAMNTVRKHCSAFSGGRLALAASCSRIEVLIVSDVRGDALPTIGSGPCTGDSTSYADAISVVDRFGLRARFPVDLLEHLEAGARGERPESPGPEHPALERVHATLVARNSTARVAAAAAAAAQGVRVLDLGEILGGEARVAGRRLAALARSIRCKGPALLIAGGETVVTLRGSGRGGRSQELALAAALEWDRGACDRATVMLAVGTDGADGPTDAAGAYVEAGLFHGKPTTRDEASRRLADNDSYGFFEKLGGLVRTGPTDTNVMDLVLIQIEGSDPG